MGFIGAREVTLVTYDPAVLSLAQLAKVAGKVCGANKLYLPTAGLADARAAGLTADTLTGYKAAPGSDQTKQLPGTAVAKLTLDLPPATKVDAGVSPALAGHRPIPSAEV